MHPHVLCTLLIGCISLSGYQPETPGGQPGTEGPLLFPGRRPAERQEGVPGVAETGPLHGWGNAQGSGLIPAEAEGAGGEAGGGGEGEHGAQRALRAAGRGERCRLRGQPLLH